MDMTKFIYVIILLVALSYLLCYLWTGAKRVILSFLLEREIAAVRAEIVDMSLETIKAYVLELTKLLEEEILKHLENTKDLTQLLEVTATEADYKEFVDTLMPLLKDLYKAYQFQLLKPVPTDHQSGYALGFQLFRMELGEKYDYLFRLAIDKGMTEAGITNAFYAAVAAGDLVEIGDAIVVEYGTGVSSILTGEDLRIYVSFMTKEYKEKKDEVEAEIRERMEAEEAKKKEMLEKRTAAYDTLMEATDVLSELTEKVRSQIPEAEELDEQYELVRDLYGKV